MNIIDFNFFYEIEIQFHARIFLFLQFQQISGLNSICMTFIYNMGVNQINLDLFL